MRKPSGVRSVVPETRNGRLALYVSGVLVLGPTSPLLAQTDGDAAPAAAAPAAPAGPSSQELLNDFVHFVLIDRADLAKEMATGLIDRAIAPAEFVRLVDGSVGIRRFTQAVLRAQRVADLEAPAASLLKLYEDGKLATVRDPKAIAEHIGQLLGMGREREFARARLVAAGEYALPQLLPALLDRTNPARSAAVRQVLVDMGRQAVMPLSVALPLLDPADQALVASILGDIPYTNSLPFLYEVVMNGKTEQARMAAEQAVGRVIGALNTALPQAERYTRLAEEYYAGSPSLISFPGEANQPVWIYDPGLGLTFRSVDSRIFPATMAMRLSELALRNDPKHQPAHALWLAGNFQREIRSPEGYVSPFYAQDRRNAEFFAVASGPAPVSGVLARALNNNDTRLAMRSLGALVRTAGGASLWSGGPSESSGNRPPLLDALNYPNRLVQYEAALALAAAGPREAFAGSEQVVRIIAGAVRDVGARYALVLAGDIERQSSMADVLRGAGYTVLPPAARIDDARQAIADAPGVDIIVTDLPAASTRDLIEQVQGDAKLRATPVLALASLQGLAELAPRFGQDVRVRLARQSIAAQELGAAVAQLANESGSGPIPAEQAEAYRTRAISALRDLGTSANPVLRVADAQGPLTGILRSTDTALPQDVRLSVAEVLGFIPTRGAQGAIVDAAMAASGADRVALLGHAAASARRSGNLLEPHQVAGVLDLVKSAQGEEATAAAALAGALNLSAGEVVPLMLEGQ